MIFTATVNEASGFISAADIGAAERYVLELLAGRGMEGATDIHRDEVSSSFSVASHTITIRPLPAPSDIHPFSAIQGGYTRSRARRTRYHDDFLDDIL